VLRYLADEDLGSIESRRFDGFLDSIDRPDDPTFWFLHLGLPHTPWHLTADGRPYDRLDIPGLGTGSSSSWSGDRLADQAIQRYVLQTVALDRMIGRLMDKLDAEDMSSDTLLAVLADHGVAFTRGQNLRAVSGLAEDMLPVPLFIRYPGQRKGAVDERSVESIDLVPTLADVLGFRLDAPTDGTSLQRDDPERDKRAWAWGNPVPGLPEEIDATSISRRIAALFGPPGGRDDLYAWGPGRDLVGTDGPDAASAGSVDGPERYERFDPDGTTVPARVTGTMRSRGSGWVAVTVNGTVAGLGRSYADGGATRFSAMIAPRYLRAGRNDVRVFLMDERGRIVVQDDPADG
jgi:hypothetical protein